MTPEDAARASALAVQTTSRHAMVAPSTFERGAALGFEGFGFYLYGRGSAVGDVDADVVAAALAFFEPGVVRAGWEAGRAVMPPGQAAREWAGTLAAWAVANVPEGAPLDRLAELAGLVVERADVGCAPLFAGWRALPEPDDVRALVVHRMNALRELRGALHAVATRAEGLRPVEAGVVADPGMVALFGWPEPWPDPEAHRAAWQRAEDRTDALVAQVLEAVTAGERAELVELSMALSKQLHRATRG